MKFKSLLWYIKVEILHLFSYPKITKYKSIDYEKYWNERLLKKDLKDFEYEKVFPNSFMKIRADLLTKEIQKIKIKKPSLFDYGSGDGRQLKAIQNSSIEYKSIVASDISQFTVSLLSKKFKTINLKTQSIKEIISKNKFDIVSAFEVLEHIDNCEEILFDLIEMTEHLLIFSVPNTGFIMHRLRLLFGRFPLQWRSSPGEHIRFWTTRDMYWWLKYVIGLEKRNFKMYHYSGFPIIEKIPFLQPLFCKGLMVCVYKKELN